MAIDRIGTNGLVAADIVPPDGSISTAKIANDAITSAKIANDAVTAAKIPAGAVVADIADGGITTAKLADDAVTSAKVADDAITGAMLANDIAISTTGNIVTTGSGTITSAGLITASGSIAVGGTGSANTLDDFEEGTWTPSILNGWGILNPTTSTATGHYTKVGNLVYVLFKIVLNGGSTNGNPLVVAGLPFSHDGTTGGSGVYDTIHGYFQSANSNATNVLGEVGNNGATAIQMRYRAATGLNNFTGTDSGNSGNLTFSGIYRTAS